MISILNRNLKKLAKQMLDNTYMTYQRYADRNLSSFLKSLLKERSYHPKTLVDIVFFNFNKHQYIVNKRDIFNALVALEENNKNEFLNSSGQALAHLFKSSPFSREVGGLINAELLSNLKSGFYINPFTNQPIEMSVVSNDVNKCVRFSTKYLFVGENDTSTIIINEQDIAEINELMHLPDDMKDRDAIIKEYTIYHELAHDSHFQNYRLYKDAVKMGVDIPKRTKMLQEIESDISSILYLIKDRKLNIEEAFEVINGVVNFRCGINFKTTWDKSLQCPTEDTIHYHITQPALLVLSRMINDEGVRFIHNMSCIEITNIAYHIADMVDDSYYLHSYKTLLPVDKNEFKYYLLDTSNESMVFFYLLSYYGGEVVNYGDKSLDFRKEKFDEMAEKLVEKLYSDNDLVINNALYFRTLVGFQYAVNITPKKVQELYLSLETKEISDIVYNGFLERLVFNKKIEIEHTRKNISISIK